MKQVAATILLRVPTGMGKTLICYCLALYLKETTDKTILLVTQTTYNKLYSTYEYGLSDHSDCYPNNNRSVRIWHCDFQDVAQLYKSIDAADFIVVVDEVDQLTDYLVTFMRSKQAGQHTAVAVSTMLSSFD